MTDFVCKMKECDFGPCHVHMSGPHSKMALASYFVCILGEGNCEFVEVEDDSV
jgi:hypothetical protein